MINVNLVKAKLIAHERRRAMREAEFAPYDKIIALQIPGTEATAAEAARQIIRDKYAVMQTSIDAAADIDSLKVVLAGV